MSYLVLARKWRPQSFDEVVGQPHVVRTLENAIRTQRVAHAYLFTGARGVGKTSVARILAKSLNCEEGASAEPCNRCDNCTEITDGRSMDVLEIDGASNRGIDNIRELRETVRYRPAKSSRKIYIIDEVHMLTTEAFNALLKTLEEPPPHVLFVFATTEPHKIPATILSRCQRFDFRRIPTGVVLDHLKRITEQEQAEFSETVLYALAQEADGSMRDAQSFLEQLLAFRDQALSDEEVLDVLGVVDRRSIYRAGRAILEGNSLGCLNVVESIYQRGLDTKRFCQQLCDYFRNLLFMSLDESAGGSWLEIPTEEQRQLSEVLDKATPESLHLYFQTLLKGEESIRRANQPRLVLEMLLLRLCQLPRLESLQDMVERLDSLLQDGLPMVAMEPRRPFKPHDAEAVETPSGWETDSRRGVEVLVPPEKSREVSGGSSPALFEAPVKTPAKDSAEAPTEARMKAATDPVSVPAAAPSSGEEANEQRTLNDVDAGVEEESSKSDPPADAQQSMEQTDNEPVVWTATDPVGDERMNEPRPAATTDPNVERMVKRWPSFLGWLQSKDPVIAAKLGQSSLEAGSGNMYRLSVMDVYEALVQTPETKQKIERLAKEYFGAALEFTIQTGGGAKTCPNPVSPSRAKRIGARRLVMEHPVVQQALEVLGGELLEIKEQAAGRRKRNR